MRCFIVLFSCILLIIFPVSRLFSPSNCFTKPEREIKKLSSHLVWRFNWKWVEFGPLFSQTLKIRKWNLSPHIEFCKVGVPESNYVFNSHLHLTPLQWKFFLLHIVNYIHIECINRYQCKAFFPREECAMHSCTPSPFSESSGAHSLLVELLLQILQGWGGH